MKKLTLTLALVGALFLISIASAQCSQIKYWGSFGNENGQFYTMAGVAADTSGNIYVAELDNRVQKFSESGEYLTQFNIPARGIAIDSDGNIYATVNNSIQKFNSTGTLLNTWVSTGTENGTFKFPAGIALDSSGNIYVSDMNNNSIQKLDSSGKYVTSWGTFGSGKVNFKSPAGIAVSGNYVYVADMGNYRIQKFDLYGNYVSSLGSEGTDDTQFNSSIAVATDPSGNIYVADYYNGRVIEYDSNFTYLTQYTGHSYPTALVTANRSLYVLNSGTHQVWKYYESISANFSTNVSEGYAPLAVQFTNMSENATSLSWDFENDGISDSNEINPVHVFTTPGVYTVNLTVSNGECTASKLAIINVTEKPILLANFSTNITSGYAPLSVQFNDLSQNATSVSWDFGDGNTSTQQNPTHTYYTAGNYTVNLTATNANGTNSISTTINVMPPTKPGLVVSYDGNITSGKLIDLSGNSNTGYVIGATQGTLLTTGANYVSFDGVDNRVNILANASTNITNNLSVEFIGNISTFNKYGILVHKYQTLNGQALSGWYISTSQNAPYNTLRFKLAGTDDSYVSNIQLNASEYYHIVVTYNGTAHIYVNSVDSANPANLGVPIIGSSVDTSLYYSPSVFNNTKGSLLLFRMYNRTLTQAEVTKNYEDNKRIYLPIPDNNIINIQKKAYGEGGLPLYMGNYAVQKQSNGLYVFSDSLSRISTVTDPYYQDNGKSETNATLLSYNISGVKWKNYYAPGSTIALNYTGTNRSINQIGTLSNDAFDLTNTVNYTGSVLTVIDGVNVIGNGNYQIYGDGIATISGDVVKSLTDDATVQTNKLYNSTGGIIYTNYQRRDAGISRTNNLEVVLSSPQLTPMLAPSGYLGTLIFASHADYSSSDSLKALMYGTNNSLDPAYGKKGFIGHGLVCTWGTFAATTNNGEGFDSPAFKTVIDDMYHHGFEITTHNVWGEVGDDLPNKTITAKYLPWYTANYSNRNWIDHGLGNGARNTGLKSLGGDPTSEYYIMDLLKDNSIIYAWSFDDYSPYEGLNMVHVPYVGMPADVVWQNTNLNLSDGTPIYQWRSEATDDLVGLNYYNNRTVNDLINDYGVNIWHGYWSDSSDAFKDYYYHRGPPATINENFDGFLTNLSARKTAGDLWNPTVAQFIDYFRQVENVSIKCTGKNTYTIVNNNPSTVSGYALRVSYLCTPKLDGVTLSTKINGADTIFWMDLQPGVHVIALGA